MDVTTLLILLLIGAVATLVSGDKLASKVALLFSLVAFGLSINLLLQFNQGTDIGFVSNWIANPKVALALKADGLSMAMVLLTTALTPLIILSSFGNSFNNSKNFYALVLFMAFAMVGTFLAADGLLYYIFWELALIPIYFIALIWGNGDVDERKKAVVKFFIYTLAGSLFMLVGFAYLYSVSTNAGTYRLIPKDSLFIGPNGWKKDAPTALEIIDNQNPTYATSQVRAMRYMQNREYEKAQPVLEKALTLAENDVQKAEIHYDLAKVHAQAGRKSSSRSEALEAAKLDPEKAKEAWLLIAQLYMGSSGDCRKGISRVDDQAIYIAAYNAYSRAGDSKGMAEARARFPSKEELFTESRQVGETVNVGCWIGETVTLATRD